MPRRVSGIIDKPKEKLDDEAEPDEIWFLRCDHGSFMACSASFDAWCAFASREDAELAADWHVQEYGIKSHPVRVKP